MVAEAYDDGGEGERGAEQHDLERGWGGQCWVVVTSLMSWKIQSI